MTNRDVALLAFKLLGLWLMATAAIGLANIPYLWVDTRYEEVRAMTIAATTLPSLISLGIGVPVWFSADWFAVRLFPGVAPDEFRADRLRAEPIFALALSIMGIFLVCESIPVVVNGIALFAQSRAAGSTVLGPDLEQRELIWSAAAKANAFAGIVRLLIGLVLLAGPARLSAGLLRIRKELRGSLAEEDPPA